MTAPSSDLRILTFNAWLLRTPLGLDLAKNIDDRFQRLPESLAQTQAHVICVQEVWAPELRQKLAREMYRLGYPHAAGTEAHSPETRWPILRYSHAYFGNGLMIFSRLPIVKEHRPLVFRSHTRADEVFVRKGALAVEVEAAGGSRVLICNSHLGAVSFSRAQAKYDRGHVLKRFRQSRELVKWLGALRYPGALFLAIDLNVHVHAWSRGSHTMDLSREVALLLGKRLKKFHLVEASLEAGAHDPIPQWTFHCHNPFVASGFFGHLPNEVTDYLFYRPSQGWKLRRVERVFVPEGGAAASPANTPLSDHYGILAEYANTGAHEQV